MARIWTMGPHYGAVERAGRASYDSPLRAERTMLVDDDLAFIPEQVRRAFPAPLYDVRSAATCADGVNQVRAAPPDVILLDLRLPAQSGRTVYEQIRAIDARIPVIFNTGSTPRSPPSMHTIGDREMSVMASNNGQRIVQYRYGDPHTVLEVEKSVRPAPPKEGEVVVRVARSMVHPGDLQLVAAKYSDPGEAIPEGRVPGLEAAGMIADAAPGALGGTGLAIGARVAFFAPGAWQTHAVVPAGALVAIPDDVNDDAATQLLINTITARHVLRAALRGLPSRPQYIVQTGASSAVGKLITAFALRGGLTPVRLVRSAESAACLAALLPGGRIVDTSATGWHAEVREAAGGDVPLVVDGVGGVMIGQIASLLRTHGRIVSYGQLGGAPADLSLFSAKALSLVGVTIGTWADETTPQDQAEDRRASIGIGREMPELFADPHVFDLAALGAALTATTAPGKTRNVLLSF